MRLAREIVEEMDERSNGWVLENTSRSLLESIIAAKLAPVREALESVDKWIEGIPPSDPCHDICETADLHRGIETALAMLSEEE